MRQLGGIAQTSAERSGGKLALLFGNSCYFCVSPPTPPSLQPMDNEWPIDRNHTCGSQLWGGMSWLVWWMVLHTDQSAGREVQLPKPGRDSRGRKVPLVSQAEFKRRTAGLRTWALEWRRTEVASWRRLIKNSYPVYKRDGNTEEEEWGFRCHSHKNVHCWPILRMVNLFSYRQRCGYNVVGADV